MIEALQTHVPCPVIWSHQNAPRPKLPYVVVEPTTVTHLSADYCPEARALVSSDMYTYRVHYAGTDALRQLVSLVTSSRAAGDPITWVGDPQFVPDLLASEEWGERAIVECQRPWLTQTDVAESWGTIDTIRATPLGDVRNPPTVIEATRGNP